MLVSLMGSSILGEVDDTSILRTELSNGYWDRLDRLAVHRLLLPRSGLEVCWACSAAWKWKSSDQPDGGEGLAKCKGCRREAAS